MSAPSSSRIPPSSPAAARRRALCRSFAVLAIGFAIAVALGGCAAPGASRLERAPEAMPPVLEHVTADVQGFTLYDTDPESKLWRASGLDGEAALAALYDQVGVTAEEVEPWIGEHAGVALRQLDVPDTDGATTVWFADVRDTRAMLDSIEDLEGDGRAAQAYDDGVLVAKSQDDLDDFIDAADSYAVPQRKAMREYAAEVATKSPAGVVFRFDLIRTQVRRPFEGNPALLEFARWATESNVLVATRDGWVGVAPPIRAGGDGFRLIGNLEWVPDLAQDIDWGSADAALLDEVDTDADLAIAFEDPGQHLQELLTAITRKNGQYATDQDVPDGDDRVEIEPVLEQLAGDAAVSVLGRRIEGLLRGAADSRPDVDDAIDLARLPAGTSRDGDDLFVVVDTNRDVDDRSSVQRSIPASGQPRGDDATSAGTPPRPPIVWAWTRSIAGCTGPAAGWVTFDGTGEMTFSLGVQSGSGDCDVAARLAELH